MLKPTITHVPGPDEKQSRAKPAATKPQAQEPERVDMLGLNLTFATLLEKIVEELIRATPSHAWDNMPTIREDVGQLRAELTVLVAARNKARRKGQ